MSVPKFSLLALTWGSRFICVCVCASTRGQCYPDIKICLAECLKPGTGVCSGNAGNVDIWRINKYMSWLGRTAAPTHGQANRGHFLFIYIKTRGEKIINCQQPWLLFSMWEIQNIVDVIQGSVQISTVIRSVSQASGWRFMQNRSWTSPSTRRRTPSTSTPWFRTCGHEGLGETWSVGKQYVWGKPHHGC